MRHILTNQPDGTRYYPCVNLDTNWGEGNYLNEAPPFYIKNLSDEECVVTLTKTGSPDPITLDYSVDNKKTWNTLSMVDVNTGSFSIPANGKAYLKGNNSTFSSSNSNYKFSFNKHCNIGGNLMSLVNVDIVSFMFTRLFYGNANLINAENLIFPDNVANHCYYYMFYGCTALETAPALPATSLYTYCYYSMFQGCTSLVTAPALPATTLAVACYFQMFQGCTSLVTAPALPAMTLANGCYGQMFYNCTSLVNAPKLPATTLAVDCYSGMFAWCTSLINSPALPATTLAQNCYGAMFQGCTSLINAPALPATTLAKNCYGAMFISCTNLNYIKAMFTTTPSSTYTNRWVSGVSSSGTFVKNSEATWDVTGPSGIPEGWTVETA